jgi:hypothetical protein
MRTTEGVWLSCTPTREYLLVTLDFEGKGIGHFGNWMTTILMMKGVHSIERSVQEDALLVLFNAAISNMVSLAYMRHIYSSKSQLPSRSFSETISPFLEILLAYSR